MKYYLVALFDEKSYSYIQGIKRKTFKINKLYRNFPVSHIRLETIEDPNINELSKVVTDIMKPYKKFKVMLDGTVTSNNSPRSVNLKVVNKGYIVRIYRNINENLKMRGFKVKNNVDRYELNVPFGSIRRSNRDNRKEYNSMCEFIQRQCTNKTITIKSIELWKSINNKKESPIKVFPLREF